MRGPLPLAPGEVARLAFGIGTARGFPALDMLPTGGDFENIGGLRADPRQLRRHPETIEQRSRFFSTLAIVLEGRIRRVGLIYGRQYLLQAAAHCARLQAVARSSST